MRGPWVIERYHKLDDNAERFLDGYWRTGDIASIDPQGYLKLADRLKDVVKSSGECDALARTSVGKLDKKKMRATYADLYTKGG